MYAQEHVALRAEIAVDAGTNLENIPTWPMTYYSHWPLGFDGKDLDFDVSLKKAWIFIFLIMKLVMFMYKTWDKNDYQLEGKSQISDDWSKWRRHWHR